MLGMSASEIDVDTPLEHYGLDSLQAVQLSGDLESIIKKKMSPTLAWDYPTINDIVLQLARGQ